MEFIRAEDQSDNEYYFRMVSTCRTYHIMVYPVLYGYRVRIGKTADTWSVDTDVCAGGNIDDVNDLYNLFLLALENCEGDHDLVNELLLTFQSSVIKPFVKDELFVHALYTMAGIWDQNQDTLRDRYKIEIRKLHDIRYGYHKRLHLQSWDINDGRVKV